ncbi:preprotein translocase subunit SecA [Slackia heliotrinireducens]|uniref:preprotein translocase subunit SecA n=1 Tax=Slackia heliotrinireducens TaxID=84110 RepID=UPI0033148933
MGFLSKLLTFGEGKQLKGYQAKADRIGTLEPSMQALSDDELRALTAAYKERVANGESLDDILPEAFAAVREASVRTLGLRHFDVQLIGGMALHEGQIAEMKTGEGKTLVSTLAGYLNALSNDGVHVVTVNDYLARRDSEWMGRVYKFLGMEVGLIQNGMRPKQRIPSYKADVTYGTNAEFGFDYLRDNMVTRAGSRVQRGHNFAIVDEVDSILIDEARTPLIISGAGVKAADTYKNFARAVRGLQRDQDYVLDEAKRTIVATEIGLAKIEARLGIDDIYADPSAQLANHLQQALKAEYVFHLDIDYVKTNGEIKIVDEFTGRIMEGRRYSEGLHQALEAKEGVRIREENQTLATITLQNYFRLYKKLSGMTGTAMTEDAEFRQIYNLPVVAIPPNKPVIRIDENDLIYRTLKGKYNAVADEVEQRHAAGQPCLVGTVSIESSELLSRILDKRGVPHETLNAKNHEREANIVAQAGRVGAVTIATNMAGRGTDILLGGNPEILAEDILAESSIDPAEATDEQRALALQQAKAITSAEHDQVIAAGGLAVIGTERHESRRIDNQLRGRAGRQGDPGLTQFYLSLEDDLMRRFGSDRMDSIGRMMEKTDIPEDMPIQHSMVSKAIESAQHQVEAMHFAARKSVLEYDDVMNLQRTAIYDERNAILDGKDMSERIESIVQDAVEAVVQDCCPARTASDDWDIKGVNSWVADMTGLGGFDASQVDHDDDPATLTDIICDHLLEVYKGKEKILGHEVMRGLESQVMLRIIDVRWMNHLQEMDYLRTGIGLRAIGQRDPLVEYKGEAHAAFANLTSGMYEDFLRTMLRLQVATPEEAEAVESQEQPDALAGNVNYSSPEAALEGAGTANAARAAAAAATPQAPKAAMQKAKTYRKDEDDDPYANVGRNDPCPCGSGKKFKKCHGMYR